MRHNRLLVALVVTLVGLTMLVAAWSVAAAPAWLQIPGGLFALVGAALLLVLRAGPHIKDWLDVLERLFGAKKEEEPGPPPPPPSMSTGDIHQHGETNVVAQTLEAEQVGGTRIIAERVVLSESHTPPNPRFTVPDPPPDFVGREEEIADLVAHIEQGVLISGITGAAGIGKTALALVVAQRLADRFPDARLYVNLRGASDAPMSPEEAMRLLLRAFYPEGALPDRPQELLSLYRDAFRRHRALLLLDDARDAAQVRDLIPPRPSAAIITSRRTFTLAGLHRLDLRLLPSEDARRLLREVAPRLQGESDAQVDKLAQLCGYLPLALRVAAARLAEREDMSLVAFLQRLQDERRRLRELRHPEDPDLDVEAAIALSYDMLDDTLQARFRRLAVFEAPFDVLAARAVWGHCGEATDPDSLPTVTLLDEAEADEALGALLRLHLLEYEQESDLYTLHDLVRLFAWQRLLKAPEEALAAVRAHAWHYLAVGAALNDMYKEGGEKVAMAVQRFAAIWSHLDAAWRRLLPPEPGQVGEGLPRPPDADLWLNALPGRVIYVFDLHISPREKIPYLEATLAAARRLGDRRGEGADLGNLGLAYHALGDVKRAIDYYQQALTIAREIGDRRGEGNRLGNLGRAYHALGDVKRAIDYYQQALAIAREIGDRRREGIRLGNLGLAYHALGDVKRAIDYYQQALDISREIGDRRNEGLWLGNLGRAYAEQDNPQQAIRLLNESLRIKQETHDYPGEAEAWQYLGYAYFRQSNIKQALELLQKSLKMLRPTQYRPLLLWALVDYAEVLLAAGQVRQALEIAQEAYTLAQQLQYRRAEALAAWHLGQAYAQLGNYKEACSLLRKRVNYERTIGHPDAEKHAREVEQVCRKAKNAG